MPLLSLVPALAGLALMVQTPALTPDLEAFEAEAQRQMQADSAPGLALSLTSEERVERVIALGLADTATGRAVQADSPFRSASTLKMVVAAALVRQARIDGTSLHTEIGTLAPDLPAFLHDLTLHQLLTHTAGLVDRTDDFGRLDDTALRDGVHALPEATRFLPPGTAFSYSNVGYNIAGHVLERMAGEPFDDALARLILDPLAMDHSTFDTDTARALGWAAPHWQGQALARNPENAAEWPSGLMYTSAGDMGRFLVALMNDGVIDGQRVWPAGLSAQLTTAHVPEGDTATGFGYGYGVMIGTVGGRPAWFHSGGLPGYRANVLVLPDAGLAAMMLANGEGFDRTALLGALIAPDHTATPAPTGPGPAASADGLAGHYVQADDLPSLCISARDGVAIIDSRGTPLTLHHAGETGLVGLDAEGQVRARYRLHRDESGAVMALSSWVRAFRRTDGECG